MDAFSVEEVVGKGAYGVVYRAKHLQNQQAYAMKRLDLQKATHQEKQCIINELRVLATHRSPFLVTFKTAFVQDHHIYFVTEFAQRGDLAGEIAKLVRTGQRMRESLVWYYFIQMLMGVQYLHRLDIIHRDLKPANIFIDQDGILRLGDFGIVKIMKKYMMFGQTHIGTPLYMAPEIFRHERYTAKADVWSLGCCLYEMLARRPAFVGRHMAELMRNVMEGRLDVQPVTRMYANPHLVQLLRDTISVSPRRRPSVEGILARQCVADQVKLRKLHTLEAKQVCPAFYVQCSVPKSLEDWPAVVNIFLNINSTIRLEDDVKLQRERILSAHQNVEREEGALDGIDAGIAELERKIVSTEAYLRQLHEQLRIERAKRAANVVARVPQPPPPRAFPAFRRRCHDIAPTPPLRLRR